MRPLLSALWFFCKLSVVVALAVYAYTEEGSLKLQWFGYYIDMSPTTLVVLLGVGLYAVGKGLSLIKTGLFRAKIYFLRNTYRKHFLAFASIIEGQYAFYSKDGDGVKRALAVAQRYLERDHVYLQLLSMQYYIVQNDREKALDVYEILLKTSGQKHLKAQMTEILYEHSDSIHRKKMLEIQKKCTYTSMEYHIAQVAAQSCFTDAHKQLLAGYKQGVIPRPVYVVENAIIKMQFSQKDAVRCIRDCLTLSLSPLRAFRLICACLSYGKNRTVKDFNKAESLLRGYETPLCFTVLASLALTVDLWGVARQYAGKAVVASKDNKPAYFHAHYVLACIEKAENGETHTYIQHLQKSHSLWAQNGIGNTLGE